MPNVCFLSSEWYLLAGSSWQHPYPYPGFYWLYKWYQSPCYNSSAGTITTRSMIMISHLTPMRNMDSGGLELLSTPPRPPLMAHLEFTTGHICVDQVIDLCTTLHYTLAFPSPVHFRSYLFSDNQSVVNSSSTISHTKLHKHQYNALCLDSPSTISRKPFPPLSLPSITYNWVHIPPCQHSSWALWLPVDWVHTSADWDFYINTDLCEDWSFFIWLGFNKIVESWCGVTKFMWESSLLS